MYNETILKGDPGIDKICIDGFCYKLFLIEIKITIGLHNKLEFRRLQIPHDFNQKFLPNQIKKLGVNSITFNASIPGGVENFFGKFL